MGEHVTDEWLILHSPDASWVWRFGQPGDEERNHLIGAARVLTGFPAHDDWISDGSGWSLTLTDGEPHHSLMARATVNADLSVVDTAAMNTYAAELKAAREAAR